MGRQQIIVIVCFMLYGCQQGMPISEIRSTEMHEPMEHRTESSDCRPEAGSDVARWLEERDRLCRLTMDEQKQKFKQIEEGGDKSTKESRMTRMLLSSCSPDMTPGLLRQALNDVSKIDDLSPDERRLIELVRSFEQSNRILESRNQSLKSDLEETVNGIREIEADIGGMDNGKVAP